MEKPEKCPWKTSSAGIERQIPKRKIGRKKVSEWRDRQLFQRAACFWASSLIYGEKTDCREWREQINTTLVRELTREMKHYGLAAAAFAVAAYDCAGGSTLAFKGSVQGLGISSPSKIIPLSRRMVCYWRASADYARAVKFIRRNEDLFAVRDYYRDRSTPDQVASTEISDYEMEQEIRKESVGDLFRRQR